ncbi:MAG: BamA/TamA family outer membrane protein [Saprospiraceae bacterium]
MYSIAKYTIQFILLLFLLASCNTAKFLGENDYLLKGNKVVFNTKQKISDKRTIIYDLSLLHKQKPNGKFFFVFPREWFYLRSVAPNDTTQLDRFQRNSIGEEPTLFKPALVEETKVDMEKYLKRKGFYRVYIDVPAPLIKKKKVYVTYFIEAGPQFLIDSVFFKSPDPLVDSILQTIKEDSYLKSGNGLDLDLFAKDKQRISKYMNNHGFADLFSYHFDQLEVDTSQNSAKANIYLNLLTPYGDSLHRQYSIGEINIHTDFDPTKADSLRSDTIIDGYQFFYKNGGTQIKPKTIIQALYLRPGELFSQENFDKTNKNLSELGTFRFVRIRQNIDSIQPNVINFRIELTPDFKMELGADFELNYTNRSNSSVSNPNLLGISLSPTFQHRNLFGGAEILATSLSAGVEINFRNKFWNAVDFRLQSDLYFPRFRDYLKGWKILNSIPIGKKKKLLGDAYYTIMEEDARTRVSGSYNYILLLDWYQYNFFNASYGYDLQRSSTKRYIIDHVGIDLLLPDTRPQFDTILNTNDFLQRSFGQQLFVSLLFRQFSYVNTGTPNQIGGRRNLSFSLEVAGAEVWAANEIYNKIQNKSTIFRLNDTIDFSQYIKFELDYRRYLNINTKQLLATRLNFGIATPFGYTSDVPYVKQFFAGGSYSLRAWFPRELGPGGFVDSLTLNNRQENSTRFYQTGDLKMIFNIEYRFDIFWRLKGALFLDGGNIWTLGYDPSRCGSQFLFKRKIFTDCSTGVDPVNDPFYKQIALGGGMGFRFDFTYVILGLDLGVKLRNPYPTLRREDGSAQEGLYWENFKGFGFRDVSFNLVLGYPF